MIEELIIFKSTRVGKEYESQVTTLINKIEEDNLEDIILSSDKETKRIGEILLESSLYNNLASSMTALDVMKMITFQLYCPSPPKVDQEFFDEMIKSAVEYKEDASENIWRLGMTYDERGYNYDLLDSYFVNKSNAYYLAEYISGVTQVDQRKITDLVLETKNIKFIEELVEDNFIQSHLKEEYYKMLKDYLKTNE